MVRRPAKICAPIDWREGRERWAHPAFLPLQYRLANLPTEDWPTLEQLNALVTGQQTGNAQRIHFVPPQSVDKIGYYEYAVFDRGEVQTRHRNWHDLFNALAWLNWSQTKAQLNTAHICELDQQLNSRRSVGRDRLTQFDEDGVVVVCACPHLADALRHFNWQALFVTQRAAWGQTIGAFIIGHALYEKMLRPYLGVTGKALIMSTEAGFFCRAGTEQAAAIDAWATAEIEAGRLTQQPLHPLPVLGIPGWDERNADRSFYGNLDYFRPGRLRC